MDKEELDDFTASNGSLEKLKKTLWCAKKRLCGEADDVSMATIEAFQLVLHVQS